MPRKKRRSYGTGSITERKDGRFQAAFFDEAGKRHYVYGSTRQEALKKLQQKQRDSEDGKLVTGPKQKLGPFLYQWLESKANIRLITRTRYKGVIDLHLVPELGDIYLHKLTPQHVQALYIKKLEEGQAPASIKFINGVLHAALETAVRWELVPRNVTELVNKPRVKKRAVKSLTFEQVQNLFTAAHGKQLEAFVALALTTGMRKGEILGLRWSDINFDEGVLTVRRGVEYISGHGFIVDEPKTEAGKREIPLLDFIVELLKVSRQIQDEQRMQLGKEWENLDLVVPGPKGGYRHPSTTNDFFNRLLHRVGFDHMRIHDLRHGLVTLLRKMKVDPETVRAILGHESIVTTLGVYGHSDMEMKRDAVNELKEVFRRGDK